LSRNPNAIHLLEKNLEKIDWSELSRNHAIHLLEKNPERIQWRELSRNPNAINLLKKNEEKINWEWLSRNPSIFKKSINYKYLYQRMNVIREELMMRCMHPKRLERFLEMGGEIDDF
jgi:prefoldin subunit 5